MQDAQLDGVRSRVYGLENALAERAVYLLDKLSRCVIHPYVMTSSSSNITQNGITSMAVEDFRNDQDGPIVFMRMRVYTADSLTGAAAAGSIFSNVSIQAFDLEGSHMLNKDPTLLPVLLSYRENTHVLDRPYVLDRRSALLVQLTEEDINGTTDVVVAVHGECVLGDLSGREVEEAIALGVYPLAGRQSSLWDTTLLYGSLFGTRPPRLKGETADKLEALRIRVAYLREMLRLAEYSTYILEDGAANLAQAVDTALSRERFRNDQNGPLAVQRIRVWSVTGGFAAAAAVAALDNLAFRFESIDERILLTKDPVLSPVLFSRADNTWVLEHPHIIGKRGSVQVSIREQNANATTDCNLAIMCEAVRNVTAEELRAAVTLGLYPFMNRARS